MKNMHRDYKRIEEIIRFLDEHRADQPDLEMLSEQAGISRFHLQRLFSDWVGISPKAFLKCLTLAHAKTLLSEGTSVLEAALESGLSGPSRLHDLCVTMEAASPGEIKSGGEGWEISVGLTETPFGYGLIAENDRGICHLSFRDTPDQESALASLREEWPSAKVHWDNQKAQTIASSIFVYEGEVASKKSLRAYVKGTEFQQRVWRALLDIPAGSLVSYSRLASQIGQASATRAVASSVAKNGLAFIIPCHRVIRETGVIGKYRWGSHRKKAIIAWESASRRLVDSPDPQSGDRS